MRIVLDLQSSQTVSRLRGIGRYSLSFAKAFARGVGDNDLRILLSDRFPETIEPVRSAFDGVIPQEHIVVFNVPGGVAEFSPANAWRVRAAELIRERFLASLNPDVVLIHSLFEGFIDEAVSSIGLLDGNWLDAVTVYDLIPLLRPGGVVDATQREWYQRKLASLKRADLMLAISEHSRNEAVSALSVPDGRVVNISSAADECFQRLNLSPDETEDTLTKYGLSRPFVMYVGGWTPRKNLNGLIEGYGLLPSSLRTCYQLAIVCEMPAEGRNRIEAASMRAGLESEEVVITGWVPDDDLVALYNLCDLFVFPSFHEGFGLPILEAMQCGAPVICSDRTSMPEVIGRSDALFEPNRPQAIAGKIAEALTNEGFRESLRSHGLDRSKQFSWTQTARRAMTAIEEAHGSPVAGGRCVVPSRRSRPSLAFVSPLPPEQTGIADYSAELLPELSRHYDIEVVVDQTHLSNRWVHSNIPIRSAKWFARHAEQFDRVLYQIGNSAFHGYQFDLLERCRGVVSLHDFFLSGAIYHFDSLGTRPGWLEQCVLASHGYAALQATVEDRLDAVWTYPANKPILDRADGMIVHSALLKQWGERYYGGDYSSDWVVIPPSRKLPIGTDRNAARTALGMNEDSFLVCTFGLMGPTKMSHRLIDSWLSSELAHDERCHLVFVGGGGGGKYCDEVAQRIEQSRRPGRAKITGWATPELFRTYLAAADMAVQLRTLSRGETSRTILDCLCHGVPTVINAHGTAVEFPDNVVIKLPDEFRDDELKSAMENLRRDQAGRSRLALSAIEHVRTRHDPATIAGLYRDAIEDFAKRESPVTDRRLIGAISSLETDPVPSDADIRRVSIAIAANEARKGKDRLLVDIGRQVEIDAGTVAQRVMKGILLELLRHPPDDLEVWPVYWDGTTYRHAHNFTCGFLGGIGTGVDDESVAAGRGDTFLGLDLAVVSTPAAKDLLQRWRGQGVAIFFVIHDLPTLDKPDWFTQEAPKVFLERMRTATTISDRMICTSQATAESVLQWCADNHPSRHRPLAISVSNIGADPNATAPCRGFAQETDALLWYTPRSGRE
jgi:glycosyltransferase involved in cell wall biosynthesis